MHADPVSFYPVYTGYADETGYGECDGFNLNFPLPHGTDDQGFLETLAAGLARIRRHEPGVLVLSLGFDAHEGDPLGVLKVSTACFGEVGKQIAGYGLPVVVIQEGGYAVDQIGPCLEIGRAACRERGCQYVS